MSIHAIPAAWDPPGGTREVSKTAGWPSTGRPAGAHTPPPLSAGAVGNCASVAGAGRPGGEVVEVGEVGEVGEVVVDRGGLVDRVADPAFDPAFDPFEDPDLDPAPDPAPEAPGREEAVRGAWDPDEPFVAAVPPPHAARRTESVATATPARAARACGTWSTGGDYVDAPARSRRPRPPGRDRGESSRSAEASPADASQPRGSPPQDLSSAS